MTPTDHALALAARGFHVFPIRAGAKTPAVDGWQAAATRDPDRIRELFKPFSNIGIATERFGASEGLLVVDIDNKHGKTGDGTILSLELEGHELPRTLETHTPTGGRHLFYRLRVPVGNSVEAIGPGIDTRSAGGYVVALGSRLLDGEGDAEGGVYTSPDPDAPLAEAPAWLVDRCGARRERAEDATTPLPGVDAERATQRAIEYLQTQAPEAVEGAGGDATTYRVAARVKDFGVSLSECVGLMAAHWHDGCGWSMDDLAIKVANAYRYGLDRPGADAPEAIFGAVPVEQPNARYHLSTVADVVSRPPPRWLVRGILPERGLGVVYGAPASGKTFLVLDVACAVARGLAWGDRRVRRGRTVYVGLEGHVGTRVAAYLKKHEIDPEDLSYLSIIERQPVNLLNPKSAIDLARDVKGALPEAPALVIVDTLNRSIPGGNENDSEVMGAAINAAGYLSSELDSLVLFVHHSGKAEGAGARGHSSLLGAADVELSVSKTETAERLVELTKSKDGQDGDCFAFTLASVDLGATREHDPEADPDERVTSCAVQGVRQLADVHVGPKVKLGTQAHLALQGLREAMAAIGFTDDNPFDDDSVLTDQWQAQVEAINEGDAGWRKKFFNGRAELLRKKLITIPAPGRVAITEAGKHQ